MYTNTYKCSNVFFPLSQCCSQQKILKP